MKKMMKVVGDESPATPRITVRGGELASLARAGEAAIITAEMPVYVRGQALVRPVVEEVDAADGRRTKVAMFVRIDATHMRYLLSRAAVWQRLDGRSKKVVVIDPPADVAQTIMTRLGEWAFPSVVGILSTPTMRPDGSILATEGYDPATRLVLAGLPLMPPIPDQPTRDDALRALELLHAALEEFPFTDGCSYSTALSALMTPVLRGAFPVAPLHALNAHVAGSGKTYIVELASAIATGQHAPVMAAGRDEAETEKRLGAALLTGQPEIVIDNVNGDLGGDALCQLIERPVVDIRILGKSERVRVENRSATIYATGNNLTILGDMTRRCLIATLDSKLERPELRQFKRDPRAAILADRGQYIAAILTIGRAYVCAGHPDPAPSLGSFGAWSDLVRSALMWLGEQDPVMTMEAARANDPRLNELTSMIAAWSQTIGIGHPSRKTTAEAIALAEERDTVFAGEGDAHEGYEKKFRHPDLHEAIATIAAPRGRIEPKLLGKWISRNKGRVVGRLRFEGETPSEGAKVQWWVAEV